MSKMPKEEVKNESEFEKIPNILEKVETNEMSVG